MLIATLSHANYDDSPCRNQVFTLDLLILYPYTYRGYGGLRVFRLRYNPQPHWNDVNHPSVYPVPAVWGCPALLKVPRGIR